MKFMFKKRIAPLLCVLILLGGFFLATPATAHANEVLYSTLNAINPGLGAAYLAYESGVSIESLLAHMLASIGALVIMVAGWFLGVAGMLLDFVIKYTVVSMSETISNTRAINTAWTVFRDLANMFFIFILIYEAIRTILGISGVSAKKVLTNVIIVALLLNFSLFFTKIMIDASNIVTLGFYNKVTEMSGGNNTTVGEHIGLAGPFLAKMGLTGLFSIDSVVAGSNGVLAGGNLKTIGINALLASTFLFITGMVFWAANIMFISRFVTLVFLMILSPIAFAGAVIPDAGMSKKWWKGLFSNLFFAPAYMAMVWVSIVVLDGVLPKRDPTKWAQVLVANGGVVPSEDALGLILSWIIVCAMIIGCLIVAKDFGAKGADSALERLKKWGASARDWTAGKVGRTALRATGVTGLDKRIRESKFGETWYGDMFRRATTGAVLNKKVYGRSINDANKDAKKRGEERANQADENARRRAATAFEENLESTRQNRSSDLSSAINNQYIANQQTRNAATAAAAAQAHVVAQTSGDRMTPEEIENLAKEISAEEAVLRNPTIFISTTERADKQNRINDAKAKIARANAAEKAVADATKEAKEKEEEHKKGLEKHAQLVEDKRKIDDLIRTKAKATKEEVEDAKTGINAHISRELNRTADTISSKRRGYKERQEAAERRYARALEKLRNSNGMIEEFVRTIPWVVEGARSARVVNWAASAVQNAYREARSSSSETAAKKLRDAAKNPGKKKREEIIAEFLRKEEEKEEGKK